MMKAMQTNKLLTFKIDDGSQNRFFSNRLGRSTGIIKIGPEQSFLKGWRQIRRITDPIPDCSETWSKFITNLYANTNGQTIMMDIRPEVAAFRIDQYEHILIRLDKELSKPHQIRLKTAHPTKRMRWGSEEFIPYQFIYDLLDLKDLADILSTFKGFFMSTLLVLKPISDLSKMADHLRKHFLDEYIDFDGVFEQIAYVIYYDFNGIILIVEGETDSLNRASSEILKLQAAKGVSH